MFRRRESSEMRTPAVLSVGVHVFAIVAMVVNFDFFSHAPLEPEPIMVEFEAIAKKAAAPKIGIQDEQPKNAKIAEETTKAPPPPSKEPPPAPETPKPEVAEATPEPPKPKEETKAEKPTPAEDLIALKPKEPEKPKTEKPDPKPDPKPEVHLRPNKLVKYASVAAVLADAQRLGVKKLGVVGSEQAAE